MYNFAEKCQEYSSTAVRRTARHNARSQKVHGLPLLQGTRRNLFETQISKLTKNLIDKYRGENDYFISILLM